MFNNNNNNNINPNSNSIAKSSAKVKRQKTPSHVQKYIACSQQWCCAHCRQLLPANFEIDHIVALCNGGTNHVSNLHALCPNCHSTKTIQDLHHNTYFADPNTMVTDNDNGDDNNFYGWTGSDDEVCIDCGENGGEEEVPVIVTPTPTTTTTTTTTTASNYPNDNCNMQIDDLSEPLPNSMYYEYDSTLRTFVVKSKYFSSSPISSSIFPNAHLSGRENLITNNVTQ